MENKVYCKDCKHSFFGYDDISNTRKLSCRLSGDLKPYMARWDVLYRECKYCNPDGHCEKYKPKFWSRVIKLFGGKK